MAGVWSRPARCAALLRPAIKGGTFEALTAASAAVTGTATMWGYTNKTKA